MKKESYEEFVRPSDGASAETPKPKKHNRTGLFIGVFVALILIAGGAWAFGTGRIKLPNATHTNTQAIAVTGTNPAPLFGIKPNYTEQLGDVSTVANYNAVKAKYDLKLTAAQEASLNTNKFLLVDAADTNMSALSSNFDQMLSNFDTIGGNSDPILRTPEDTVLVTPDVVLNGYHKYFEMTLEQLEQTSLASDLGSFITSLHSNLAQAVASSTGTTKERYQNLEAQIVLARVLFETKNAPKPDLFDTPEQETAYNNADSTSDTAAAAKQTLTKYTSDLTPDLIAAIQSDIDDVYAATTSKASALFGQYSDTVKTDFTQFTPRSHYTKNSALRAYFRTMMYLGRSSYYLKKDVGITDAALLAKQFSVKSSSGVTPADIWSKVMTVTGFYAGQSDDLTYTEWSSYLNAQLGSNVSDTQLASTDSTQKLAGNLNALPQPKILSDVIVDDQIFSKTKADLLRDTLGFRIFGQRFTFDAWVLNDLTAGQEKTDVALPSTPSSLFVPAAMGDPAATTYAQQFLKQDSGFSDKQVSDFVTKLDAKKADIAKVTSSEWFDSMSSAWLYVLGGLTHTYDSHYPQYMQSNSFLAKQVQTFLGSYTELKHDTLLYAKQSYAERGGGPAEGSIPPIVKGFVEPNLDFWTRFGTLLDKTQTFIKQNNLFTGNTAKVAARLDEFKTDTAFYKGIAEKEIAGTTISSDDYEHLRTMTLSYMATPFDSSAEPTQDTAKTALVADIHTDTVKGKILYEGTAKPYLMLAVVGNENSPRVVAGITYNHYEFTQDIGKRLTDEDWQKNVYDNTSALPSKNFWYQSLLVK